MCWLMFVNVLFISAGLDFCHSDNCHDRAGEVSEGVTLSNQEVDSCIACTFDFFQELYFEETKSFHFFSIYEGTFTVENEIGLHFFTTFFTGRAPPIA